jgi:sec-independent protein translocase protein TatB
MFEVSFQELLLVAIVALVVLGPERLPSALRTLGLWLGRLRRSFDSVKQEIEREIGMDDVRRQLHNEMVMGELKRIETDLSAAASGQAPASKPVDQSANSAADKRADQSEDKPANRSLSAAAPAVEAGVRDA